MSVSVLYLHTNLLAPSSFLLLANTQPSLHLNLSSNHNLIMTPSSIVFFVLFIAFSINCDSFSIQTKISRAATSAPHLMKTGRSSQITMTSTESVSDQVQLGRVTMYTKQGQSISQDVQELWMTLKLSSGRLFCIRINDYQRMGMIDLLLHFWRHHEPNTISKTVFVLTDCLHYTPRWSHKYLV